VDFETFRDELQTNIHEAELNAEFSLEELFGGVWPEMPEGVRNNDLGLWFKRHVQGSPRFEGVRPFDGIEFSRKNSANRSLYRLSAN
jgi:hypothetical protein